MANYIRINPLRAPQPKPLGMMMPEGKSAMSGPTDYLGHFGNTANVRAGHNTNGKMHPGFKGAQASIQKKEGVSKKAAGAILASATRKASAKAKRKNPRLKRVK